MISPALVWPAAARERPAKASRSASGEFLGVGQGDAILIRSPEGEKALVDSGPHKELVVELLRRRGVQSLDREPWSRHAYSPGTRKSPTIPRALAVVETGPPGVLSLGEL
jgi:hypothetical protein